MNEIFVESPTAPGYMISNMGRVMNMKTGNVFIGRINRTTGYREIGIKQGGKLRYFLVHRLVAEVFCEKPVGIETEVNHINGDRLDERAVNLEWITHAENLHHCYVIGKREYDVAPKSVIATSMETGEQMEFPSIYKAARFLGISQGNICMACKGERPYAGGYLWGYKNETDY